MPILLDPTSESQPAHREILPRLPSLDGATLALLDISKPRGDLFLDHLQRQLEAQDVTVRRYQKPTFTRPAPADLLHQIVAECDGVIEALAD